MAKESGGARAQRKGPSLPQALNNFLISFDLLSNTTAEVRLRFEIEGSDKEFRQDWDGAAESRLPRR